MRDDVAEQLDVDVIRSRDAHDRVLGEVKIVAEGCSTSRCLGFL